MNISSENSEKSVKNLLNKSLEEPNVRIQKIEKNGKCTLINPGLCRCCRAIKKCRVLTSEYEWMGKKEVYSELFVECFGLLLSQLDGEDIQLGVCATCVNRLRAAVAFKQQVLQSEEAFLTALDNKDEIHCSLGLFNHSIKIEPICEDEQHSEGGGLESDNVDDPDYMVDTKADSDQAIKSSEDLPLSKMVDAQSKKYRKKSLGTNTIRVRRKRLKTEDTSLIKTEVRKKVLQRSKKNDDSDHDYFAYANALTIVKNSYVCPFLNRISNYYCYYCRDQFVDPNELRQHTLSHNPIFFESMMDNKKVPKIDITRVDCRLCDEKIDDLETFKRHITSVHAIKLHPIENEFLKFRLTKGSLTCTECDSTFPYFDSLKKHMIDHFGTYICDQCGACFLEENSLRTHIKSHNKVDSNFPCEICGKNLKSKYSRYLHVATVHEKKATVNCYKCEASFLSYALRNRHLIEVHGDNRTFPCKLCDKVYNRRKTLMEHNRRNHLKVFRHQCDLCDQRFYLPSRLREHMATHTGERNYRCELCDKSYPRPQALHEHLRSHNAARRFKCDQCDSAFTQNCSLKNHMKSHQQGYDLDNSFS